jgi:hypothetical protein
MVGGVRAASGSNKFAPRKDENEKHVGRWWNADVQTEYSPVMCS